MLGETVGKYRIGELIGEGGMGSVYRAEHTLIGKRVAVKVLRPSYSADREMLARFFNEARAAAKIAHPGIVDVHDFGSEGERAYLVMELLEGEPLSARLRRGPVDEEMAVRLARQIASALTAAHEHGITHRDLKPDNVFLVADDSVQGGVRAKILDFGIAKLIERDGTSSVETGAGALLGTPVYMSPEQCRGNGEVDHRVDLYSLGCILFEMCAGRPPFVRTGVGDLIAAHISAEPPRLGELTEIDAQLDDVVGALLAKDPAARPASARELVALLDGEEMPTFPGTTGDEAHLPTLSSGDQVAHISTAPTAHADPGRISTLSAAAAEHSGEHILPGPRRSRRSGIVVAAIAGALGCALAIWFFQRDRGSKEDVAAPVAVDAGIPLRKPTVGLTQLEGFRNASGSATSVYGQPEGWRNAADDFARSITHPAAPVRWKAAAALCRGYEALNLGHKSEAVQHMKRAVTLEPGWGLAQLGMGRALEEAGRLDEAMKHARLAEQAEARWWAPLVLVARIHQTAKREREAIEAYRRALVRAPKEPLVLARLAILFHAKRMDGPALDYAKRALALDSELVSARLVLAERALEKGNGAEALEHTERIIAVEPRSSAAQLAHGDALALVGRKDEARAAYQRTLELIDDGAQSGPPPRRIAQVRRALRHNKLPRARHVGTSKQSRTRRKRSRRPRHGDKRERDRSDRSRKPDRSFKKGGGLIDL
jgi:serine/threonine protein kinase/tetratricopeptide (TPR) repeat protein